MSALAPLWLIAAVIVVVTATGLVKRLLPHDASPWWPRLVAFGVAVGGSLVPGAMPSDDPIGQLGLAIVAAVAGVFSWHGARDLGLVKGRAQSLMERAK